MQVRVKFFAAAADAAGMSEATLEVGAAATAGSVCATLRERHTALRSLPLRVAVNQEFVEPDHALTDNDEVALLPPVSGG